MDRVFFRMNEMPCKALWVHQAEKGRGPLLNGISKEPGLKRTGQGVVSKKIGDVISENLEKLRQRQKHGDVQIKGYLGVGETAPAKAIMIEEVIQMPPIFDGIDHCAFPMHLFKVLGHVFIKPDALKQCVKKPTQEEAGFVIKDKRIMGLFSGRIHNANLNPTII
jgi:hypothetical protein